MCHEHDSLAAVLNKMKMTSSKEMDSPAVEMQVSTASAGDVVSKLSTSGCNSVVCFKADQPPIGTKEVDEKAAVELVASEPKMTINKVRET